LTASDFELTEDGAPRALENVTFVGPSTGGGRPFAIFLDDYHVSAGEATARVREAMVRFIEKALAPDDLLVVMRPLDSLFDIHFTRDRAAALRTIAAFEGRRDDFAPKNAYEANYFAGDPVRIASSRMQVAVSAVHALAQELGRTSDRRKTLVV